MKLDGQGGELRGAGGGACVGDGGGGVGGWTSNRSGTLYPKVTKLVGQKKLKKLLRWQFFSLSEVYAVHVRYHCST